MFESPTVHVVPIISDLPNSNGNQVILRAWCNLMRAAMGRDSVDFLFSSERGTYAEGTSANLGAQHIMNDPDRRLAPISGTAIRKDPLSAWDYLDTPVRGYFAARILLVGKAATSVAAVLAHRYHTTWTEAGGEAEDLAARRAMRLLFCAARGDVQTKQYAMICDADISEAVETISKRIEMRWSALKPGGAWRSRERLS
jgi:hypothetical protein